MLQTIIDELVQLTILTNSAQWGFQEKSCQVMKHPMDIPPSLRYFAFDYPSVSRKAVWIQMSSKFNHTR